MTGAPFGIVTVIFGTDIKFPVISSVFYIIYGNIKKTPPVFFTAPLSLLDFLHTSPPVGRTR
jgi:hypothetical protein